MYNHIVNDDSIFDQYVVLKNLINVKLGDRRKLKATEIGKIKALFQTYNRNHEITLNNVFYVKDMKQNLISYSKITQQNRIVSQGNDSKIFNQNREIIAIAKKIGNLYHMESISVSSQRH